VLLSSSSAFRRFTTINAAIFTGARTNFAMGRELPMFPHARRTGEKGSTPANGAFAAGRDYSSADCCGGALTARDRLDAMVGVNGAGIWTFFR